MFLFEFSNFGGINYGRRKCFKPSTIWNVFPFCNELHYLLINYLIDISLSRALFDYLLGANEEISQKFFCVLIFWIILYLQDIAVVVIIFDRIKLIGDFKERFILFLRLQNVNFGVSAAIENMLKHTLHLRFQGFVF